MHIYVHVNTHAQKHLYTHILDRHKTHMYWIDSIDCYSKHLYPFSYPKTYPLESEKAKVPHYDYGFIKLFLYG